MTVAIPVVSYVVFSLEMIHVDKTLQYSGAPLKWTPLGPLLRMSVVCNMEVSVFQRLVVYF